LLDSLSRLAAALPRPIPQPLCQGCREDATARQIGVTASWSSSGRPLLLHGEVSCDRRRGDEEAETTQRLFPRCSMRELHASGQPPLTAKAGQHTARKKTREIAGLQPRSQGVAQPQADLCPAFRPIAACGCLDGAAPIGSFSTTAGKPKDCGRGA
jgi:hypothetical protein